MANSETIIVQPRKPTSNRQLPKWLRCATSVTAETLDESLKRLTFIEVGSLEGCVVIRSHEH